MRRRLQEPLAYDGARRRWHHDDAKQYQVRAVQLAIEESKK